MAERSDFLSDKLFHVGNRVTKHQDQMRAGNLPGAEEPSTPAPGNAAPEIAPEQRAARFRRLEEIRQARRDLEQRLAKALVETEDCRTRAEAAAEEAVQRLKRLQERQQELTQLTIPEEAPLPSPAELGNCFREIDRQKLEFFRDELQYAAPAERAAAPETQVSAARESFGGAMRRGFAFLLPLMVFLLLTAAGVCAFFFWLWS